MSVARCGSTGGGPERAPVAGAIQVGVSEQIGKPNWGRLYAFILLKNPLFSDEWRLSQKVSKIFTR
jgi:hypothetical protein